jgi:hypothetical protein
MPSEFVLHRKTKAVERNVHTPRYSPADWLIEPDLSDVQGVDKKYWKIVGDSVLQMSQAEKDAVDTAEFDGQKAVRFAEIDAKTGALIDAGFEYPASSGDFYSLSVHAQITLIGANQNRALLSYPVRFNRRNDGSGFIDIANQGDLNTFFLTALGTVRACLDAGTAVKDQVRAATNKAELDAVEDNR